MIKFAERMNNVKESDVTEILKITQRPDIISFAGGLPAPELFPIEQIKNASSEMMDKYGRIALQYGPTEGLVSLREKIAKRMEKFHIKTKKENILILNGSQQGLDFMGKIFINENDVVLCESPTYMGAINALIPYGTKFIEIETDEFGMIMTDLEKKLKNIDKIKLIYVIPDFQNPTGKTWSLERRKQLYELASKYDVLIAEDNPYGELKFEGEILPSIKSFDVENRVIYFGTFSKILCPGYRIAWMCASDNILERFNMIKQASDLHTSTKGQYEINEFLEMFDLDLHVETLKEVYKRRRDLMLETIESLFPSEVSIVKPQGGLFLWMEFPEGINTRDLAKKAINKKVAFVPGDIFFPNGDNFRCCRINYSNASEEMIIEGISRLADIVNFEVNSLK